MVSYILEETLHNFMHTINSIQERWKQLTIPFFWMREGKRVVCVKDLSLLVAVTDSEEFSKASPAYITYCSLN